MRKGRVKKILSKLAFDQLGPDPPPPPTKLALRIFKCFDLFIFILMDSIHFKTDFSMKTKLYFFVFTSFTPLLFTVSKL